MLRKHRKYFVVDVVGSLWDGPQRSLTLCIYALVWSFPFYARFGLCDQWHMGEVIARHCQDNFYRSVASVLVAFLYVLSDRGCWGSQLPCDKDIQETGVAIMVRNWFLPVTTGVSSGADSLAPVKLVNQHDLTAHHLRARFLTLRNCVK